MHVILAMLTKELVLAIMEAQMEKDGNYYMEGILDDIQQDGYGFLRTVNYSKGEKDIYISASQIRRFEIKRGDKVTGKVRKPKDNEKYYGLLQVDFVNDHNAEEVKKRPHFQALTPLYPEERILLETQSTNYSTRIMDLVTPIGLGQRSQVIQIILFHLLVTFISESTERLIIYWFPIF